MQPHMYGCIFTEHIEFHRLHGGFGGWELCRLQKISVAKGHPAYPPKGVDLVVWGIKFDVKMDQEHRRLGGQPTSPVMVVAMHIHECPAKKACCFELELKDIQDRESGLKLEYQLAVDLVSKLDEKFQD